MLICRKHNLCYIHIPKTGGISVSWALYPFLDVMSDAGRKPSPQSPGSFKHCHVIGHHSIPNQGEGMIRPGDVVACTVRDPFDRMLSIAHSIAGPKEEALLDKIVRVCGNPASEYKRPWPWGIQQIGGLQQIHWATGCNHIMRFENLEQDFQDLCEKVGLPPIKLPHLNDHSKKTPPKPVLTRETKDLIESVWPEDVKAYG